MPILTRRSCVLMLALPLAALADPVAVTTRSTGTSTVDDTVLSALGLNSVTSTAPVPYELTLRSTFDPDTSPPSTSDYWAYNYGGAVEIDFRIGSQAYHYDGAANSYANRQSGSWDGYTHAIYFDTPGPTTSNYTVYFYHTLYGLPGTSGLGGPLMPLDADASDGVQGYYTLHATPSNHDVPLSWYMDAYQSTVSINVAAVPEPASFALLAAGLATLGLRRRWPKLRAARRA